MLVTLGSHSIPHCNIASLSPLNKNLKIKTLVTAIKLLEDGYIMVMQYMFKIH